MVFYFDILLYIFSEYFFVLGFFFIDCIFVNVSLKIFVIKFKKGEEVDIYMNIFLIFVIM